MKNTALILSWGARTIAALIMLQTLYFKFTANPESVEIFTMIGMEPWGRIGVGVLELVASVLLIVNATVWLGALLSAGLMAGALGMHLTLLGIEVQGDGGYLFFLSAVVMACSLWLIGRNMRRIRLVISGLRR